MFAILVWIIVIASSSWVLLDARSIGVKKGQARGLTDMGPARWFIACLLLWIIAFPIYLAKRPQYKRINGKDSSNILATTVGIILIALVILPIVLGVFALAFLASQ